MEVSLKNIRYVFDLVPHTKNGLSWIEEKIDSSRSECQDIYLQCELNTPST